MKFPRYRLLYLSRTVLTIWFAIALTAPTPSAGAEIKILCSRTMNHVLDGLADAFQRTSEHKITRSLAVPNEIRRRLASGESADVIMSGGPLIGDLVQQGMIAPGDKVVLARVGVGVAVRAGAAKPDIGSVEAFKRTLLAAKSIVYTDPASGGGSGVHFEKVLDRLGIAKEVKAKSLKNAQAATKPSAEFVARGEAELGIQYISEIVEFPGTELLGPFPAELQTTNVIYAGILKTAPHRDAAMALFKFLTSPDAAAAIKAAGMDPWGS